MSRLAEIPVFPNYLARSDEVILWAFYGAPKSGEQRRLAEEFNISTSTINDIVHCRSWTVMTGGV